ncbi:MAG: type I-E CRISPR-associated protein Cse2/CasB [Sandaracinaceae bacterium]
MTQEDSTTPARASDATEDAPPRQHEIIGRLAHAIQHETFLSAGDIAELRRMSLELPAPAFWRIVASSLEPILPAGGEARDRAERAWATLISALAHAKGAHSPRPLGRALIEAGVTEDRLEALLRADGAVLPDRLRTVVHLADSRGVSLDFDALARLLLHSPDQSRGQAVRRRIARDYYAALYRKENS